MSASLHRSLDGTKVVMYAQPGMYDSFGSFTDMEAESHARLHNS